MASAADSRESGPHGARERVLGRGRDSVSIGCVAQWSFLHCSAHVSAQTISRTNEARAARQEGVTPSITALQRSTSRSHQPPLPTPREVIEEATVRWNNRLAARALLRWLSKGRRRVKAARSVRQCTLAPS